MTAPCKSNHLGPCSGDICPQCGRCEEWCKKTECGWEEAEGEGAGLTHAVVSMAAQTLTEQCFNLPWIPTGKGAIKTTVLKGPDGNPRRDKHGRVMIVKYKPEKTRLTEASLRQMLEDKGAQLFPAYIPLRIDVVFMLMKPPSWSKKANHPTKKPDLDNLMKSLKDSGTGILWPDDAQIIEERSKKVFAPKPGIRLRVSVLEPIALSDPINLSFDDLFAGEIAA